MQFCKSIHLIEVVQKSVYYLGSCTLKNSLISKYIPNAEWHNFEVLKRKALSICWGYTMMIWKLVQISGHSASFSYFWQSPSSTSHQQPLVSWKFGSLVLLFKTGSYLSQSLTYMCVCLYWYDFYDITNKNNFDFPCGLFGWHEFEFGFGFERAQIQILCLDNLKELDLDLAKSILDFRDPNPWIWNTLPNPRI